MYLRYFEILTESHKQDYTGRKRESLLYSGLFHGGKLAIKRGKDATFKGSFRWVNLLYSLFSGGGEAVV